MAYRKNMHYKKVGHSAPFKKGVYVLLFLHIVPESKLPLLGDKLIPPLIIRESS